MILQYSHAVGLPYALTLASHFLQIDDVLDLLENIIIIHTATTGAGARSYIASTYQVMQHLPPSALGR